MSVIFTSHAAEVLSKERMAKRTALEIIGGRAESYAKAACPVRTGNLRNSITHEQESENVEVIGTNVSYGPYVELGTSRMGAKPFLRPAAEGHVGEFKEILRQVMENA